MRKINMNRIVRITLDRLAELVQEKDQDFDIFNSNQEIRIICGHDNDGGFYLDDFEIVLKSRNPHIVFGCCNHCFNRIIGQLVREHDVNLF